ncbi:MAG TPA: AraC family ligand binding domain-containing protein, partial [Acidobacteriota bacterium]|nr:AraC family ligand binding domain-containing protein [Acidobacteriota bacterium]
MGKTNSQEDIRFWRVPGWEQIEVIRGRRVVRECPRHWHEEIHMCFIEAGGGTLFYRGTNHHTPPGSLFIVEPGETHGNYTQSLTGCNYRTLNITPEIFHRLIFEVTELDKFPFFMKVPVVFDT